MRKSGVLIILAFLAVMVFQANALQLIVHVNDSSSNVSGVTVFVYNTSDLGINYTNTTNSTGHAAFNFSSWNYTINVSKLGYFSNSTQINLTENTTVNFTLNADSSSPTVSLSSPVDNYNTSDTTPELNFSVIDNLASSLNCTLYLDGSASTNTIATNNSITTFTPTVAQGLHNWTVSCVDDASNEHNASLRNFYVDTTSPSVTITSPDDDLITNSENITFNWTASDSYSPTVSCNLYINSTLNTTIVDNGTFSTEVLYFNSGSFDYYVSCNDSSNNTATATTQTVNIDNNHAPEITLTLSDNITQNATSVTLTAQIFSYSNVTNVNYTLAGTSNNLSLNSGTVVNGSWTATVILNDSATNITVYAYDVYNDTNSDYVIYSIDDTAPTTNVSSFTVTNTSTGSLNLSWTNDDANYRHRIYRSTSNFTSNASEGTLVGTAAAGATSYEDNTTTIGTMYYYAIVSLDQADNYNLSIYNEGNNTPTDSTIPKIPTTISASLLTNNAIRLTWNAVTQDITGHTETGTITYYVFRSTSLPVNTSGTAQLSTTATTVDDKYTDLNGDLSNRTYYYTVIAADASGNKNTTNTTYTNKTVGDECSNSFSYGEYGSCVDGIKTREGTRYCYGLDFDNDIEEVDDDNVCSSTESNTDTGSDTGGTETSNLLATWSDISVDPYEYEIPKDDFSIKKIVWVPKASAQSASIKLIAHSGKPSSVSELETTIFKFFEINAYGFELEKADIEFYVTNVWLALNDIQNEEVTLWHYDDGWIMEDTKFLRQEGDKSFFGATLTSFSVFAVGTKELVVNTSTTDTVEEKAEVENTNEATANVVKEQAKEEVVEEVVEENETESNKTGIWVLLSIIVVLGGGGYYFGYQNPIMGKKLMLKSQEYYYRARSIKVPKKLSLEEEKVAEAEKKMAAAKKRKQAAEKAKREAEEKAKVPETEEEALKKYEKRDHILKFD